MNGGGGSFAYNLTRLIGIKADSMGYAVATGCTHMLINAGHPASGSASGKMSTNMFGPQIKKHSGNFQPFVAGLFGAAHSNGYASILPCISGDDSTSCNLSHGNGNNNAFAMEFGGGMDIALSKTIQIRPVEVDCLRTNFGSNLVAHIANNQNNFKYFAGVRFHFQRQVTQSLISLAPSWSAGAVVSRGAGSSGRHRAPVLCALLASWHMACFVSAKSPKADPRSTSTATATAC